MDLKNLSKADTTCLLEFISDSLYCKGEEDFRQLFVKFKQLMPFDYAVCGHGKIYQSGTIKSFQAVNINFPDEFLATYFQHKLHLVDPIIAHHICCPTLQYWSDTFKLYNTNKEYVFFARSFGLENGCAHGMMNYEDFYGSLFSFAGRSLARDGHTDIILECVIPHLHATLVKSLYSDDSKPECILSSKERDVLNWLKVGKSSWEISVILGISLNTVNFHVKNIVRKLGATNRTHAVGLAIQMGIVDID